MTDSGTNPPTLIDRLIRFSLENLLVIILVTVAVVGWGVMVAPFDWQTHLIPRDPVPVDAIPDIGENQQIVFTNWPGRSPKTMEDQVTYPLTTALLGLPGVKTIRSYSMFGFSSVYIIFDESVDFYWSRSRILEKLNALPPGLLPAGVSPTLGPDATGLGQVYWYTLEGRDEQGHPAGGWGPDELRRIQDFYVRYALQASPGVSEVASIGGFVREYQVDVDPDAMRAHGVTLDEVVNAVRMSNSEVGARTIETNRAEYLVRGLGYIQKPEDLEQAVVKVKDNVPIYVRNVARVGMGPAARRGALDKEGVEAVGGVVIVRYGSNPLAAIHALKKKIAAISPGLPEKILADGRKSKVTIVPFYDRTGLILETLGTLGTALYEEILVTIIVIVVMVMHLASSLLISALLPLAVLLCFILMKYTGIDANIVALSGIAIAIGTMVDMGIVICENILKRLDEAPDGSSRMETVYAATSEVGGAIFTAVSTTVVSFLPVFTMEAAEGKLFRPLAFTKTYALGASLAVALFLIPPFAALLFHRKPAAGLRRLLWPVTLMLLAIASFHYLSIWACLLILLLAAHALVKDSLSPSHQQRFLLLINLTIATWGVFLLATDWIPLGPEQGNLLNFIFTALLVGGFLLFFQIFVWCYPSMLRWCLEHKALFLTIPLLLILCGMNVWLGFFTVFGWLPQSILHLPAVSRLGHAFPGLGKEFMPSLDEGSYLYMPTTMPHASIGEVLDVISVQDKAISAIPEVEQAVGKLGRAETPLDPAPISMIETVINYRPEFIVNESGHRLSFRWQADENDFFRDFQGQPVLAPDGKPYRIAGKFARDKQGNLIPDEDGKPFRLWRPALNPDLNENREAWPGIRTPDDIWQEILTAADVPGITSAPVLQPISARIVMLQSGMRAAMGVKIQGPDLATLEAFAMEIEHHMKEVPSVEPAAVIADRVVGKPYLEIDVDRTACARYGIHVQKLHNIMEVALGGMPMAQSVEGRERFPIRVRYLRELRDTPEALMRILIPGAGGQQIPLSQVATLRYVRGPQVIKSEDTFLTAYVLFDKKPGFAEVDVVNQAKAELDRKIASKDLVVPAGVSFHFAGSYENQVRSEQKLRVILPLALFIIFLILYLNFRRVSTTLLVFTGILVAWSGGFILIGLYNLPGFLDFSILGVNLRDLFQIRSINLSVAVWVGFLALFGIASDDGVIMASYLDDVYKRDKPRGIKAIRAATLEAGTRRIRPCMMTTATTILALLPILTSTGRGSDVMVPMAIPSFGGMMIEIVTLFVVPVIYTWLREREDGIQNTEYGIQNGE